jgi:hypothetical protein
MENNPENWTIPAELPAAFELPQPFRQSLPNEVQEWLDSVEKRIDGLTLQRIEEEANRLYDAVGPNVTEGGLDDDDLYRFGRRLFYVRMQQIVELMFPGQGVEVGVDLLWSQTTNDLPGSAVTTAVVNGEDLNTGCLKQLKAAGFSVGGSWLG